MAFDAEYTSLDPKNMRLVSYALVPVEGDIVKVSQSIYVVVSQKQTGPSAKIHGILGNMGIEENEALSLLYRHIVGKTLIVYTTIDINFLKRTFGKKIKNLKYIDVSKWYIKYISGRSWTELELLKGVNLEVAAKNMGVDVTSFIFHNSLLDAIHVALIYLKLKKLGIKIKEEKV